MITMFRKDNFRVGKQGSIWNNGNTWDNITWDSFKLKSRCRLGVQEKPKLSL
jgi:hypothetical protein